MTEEYKKVLLKYLKGNLPLENGKNNIIIKNIKNPNHEEWIFEDTVFINQIEQIPENIGNGFVLCGSYGDNKGIVIVLDENLDIKKYYTKDSSGQFLNEIYGLYIDQDRIYAVDGVRNDNYNIIQNNLLYMNNFINDANEIVITKKYSFSSDYLFNKVNSIRKSPTTSEFVFYVDGYNFNLYIIYLKINVGEENKSEYMSVNSVVYCTDYTSWDNNSLKIKMLASGDARDKNLYEFTNQDFTLSKKVIYTFDDLYYRPSKSSPTSQYKTENTVYFAVNNYGVSDGTLIDRNILLLKWDGTKITTLYKKNYGKAETINPSPEQILVYKDGTDIVLQRFLFTFDDTQEYGNVSIEYSHLENDTINWISIIQYENIVNNTDVFGGISKNYNLRNFINLPIIIQKVLNIDWYSTMFKEVYNQYNYNGEPYINTNALISHSGELYSNDNLVFARNLYNKTISENTTVSTIEIPNNYLNNIDITQKKMLSETNLNLIQDNNVIQKNVYETLLINFIDTLIISDQNNSAKTINSSASAYLNSSINDSSKYDSSKFYNKGILTYQDGSTKEINYEFQDINDTSTNILFGVYVDKLINKLEIISNDKSTVYQTIDLTGLEINKIYNIKQKMEVL